MQLMPKHAALVLDVGAGSGRDAEWFSRKGHEVVAVEPCFELRQHGTNTSPAAVRWLDDSLPALSRVQELGFKFDLILVSAVWMHVPPSDRPRALRKLAGLLRPGGVLVFSLRETPFDDGRSFYSTSLPELWAEARGLMLEKVLELPTADHLCRPGVKWTTVVFRMPDDGTGALPLLRHIILNDAKSSTYKLALLRCLLRIADGYPGLSKEDADDTVSVPLGLVALVWIRMFKRLLLDPPVPLPQQPSGNKGLGFAGAGFNALASVSTYDLRPGATFVGDQAMALTAALRDASKTIAEMPAFYIRFPNTTQQVFVPERGRAPRKPIERLTPEALAVFGELRVPVHLWDSLRCHACWIEPALVSEWARMVGVYLGRSPGAAPGPEVVQWLDWLDPDRQTAEVRSIAERLRSQGTELVCVWSGDRLPLQFDVDHCLPFSVWPNNDLWNLLPTSPSINRGRRGKFDRLVSSERLMASARYIQEWWQLAYLEGGLADRFRIEAEAALPLVRRREGDLPERVWYGIELQRTNLRRNQQVPEWG